MRSLLILIIILLSQEIVHAQRTPSEIAVFNLETNELIRLTFNEFADEEPEWSPDGSLIIFDSDRAGSNDLYQMKPDGTDITRLTYDSAKEDHGAWSRDGSKLLFQYDAGSNTDVWLMDKDGKNRISLTENSARDGWAD
ncbi:hypothetical protein V8G69_08455 [Gaetbulibacter sp. M235]|uniref:TolB family protein n=1 Tax=Gaetbulibacter sp. M235 TaxID=3126510 RepID=UPI00374E7CC2